jgi:hypothetical protein
VASKLEGLSAANRMSRNGCWSKLKDCRFAKKIKKSYLKETVETKHRVR